MSKWIEFSEPRSSKSGKTNIWAIYTKNQEELFSDLRLGQVQWRSPWRTYAFFPEGDTLYNAECLRDIAQFCEDKTKEHRQLLKKRNE